MSSIKNKIFAVSALGLAILAGCKKADFAINTNQDAITENSFNFKTVLAPSQIATSTVVSTNFATVNRWMGLWARSGNFQANTPEETYTFNNTTGFNSNAWANLYLNIKNYDLVRTGARAGKAGIYEGIARIMKVHNFGMLVDLYGNIPYKQAINPNVYPTPAYDNGLDVYKGLVVDLDSAIAVFRNPAYNSTFGNSEIATNDLIFAGDVNKWIRFANTLKLRLAIHAYNVPAFNSAGVIAAAAADGGFLAATENVILNPGFVSTKPTPFYRSFGVDETGTNVGSFPRANSYALGYYAYNGDPRVDRFYIPPTGGHKGIAFGYAGADAILNLTGNKLSEITGPGLVPTGASSRAWILTGAESAFLQAEARQRGLLTTGSTASALLTAAIQSNFVFLGLTTTAANSYISFNAGYPDVDITYAGGGNGPAGGVFTIISQKWFSLNAINPLEIWTDYRRTNFVYGAPVFYFPNAASGYAPNTPGPAISQLPANASPIIPNRFFYPSSEYSFNPVSVGTQGNINVFTSKIFWDNL